MTERSFNISELADLVDGEVRGEDVRISGLVDIDAAGPGQIAYLEAGRDPSSASGSGASALIVSKKADTQALALPLILVGDPVWAAAVIHNHLLHEEFIAGGIHASSVVGKGCEIPAEITIGPLVVIGDRVRIGKRVRVGAGTVIGSDVSIGSDSLIHPNVTILDGSLLGDRVIIHSGTVLGSDGFGYAHDSRGRHVKRPHVGHVQIDDDVEIGANCCVDRGTFGKTWIKRGCKIDNLVQVAHNVIIGEDSIMAGQSGIAGSTELGNGVIVGGNSAITGHIKLGDRVMVGGHSAVINDQEGGVVLAGFPAFSHRQWLRASAAFQKLPDIVREIREIRKRLAAADPDADDQK